MRSYLPWILLFGGALFSSLTVVCAIVIIRAFREQRTTIFPIVKESAEVRMKRYAALAVATTVLAALSIGGWVATQQNPETSLATPLQPPPEVVPSVETTPVPSVGVTDAISALPTADEETLSPQSTPTGNIVGSTTIVTPEASPAPTQAEQPAIPSPTPLTHIAPSATPTFPASVLENGSIGPIAFATGITSRRQPITPTTVFTAPEQIYAVFPYSGMKNGLPFSVVWYYQNREILRDESTWEWGTTDHSFVFVKPIGPGDYRLELSVGDAVTSTGSFRINP